MSATPFEAARAHTEQEHAVGLLHVVNTDGSCAEPADTNLSTFWQPGWEATRRDWCFTVLLDGRVHELHTERCLAAAHGNGKPPAASVPQAPPPSQTHFADIDGDDLDDPDELPTTASAPRLATPPVASNLPKVRWPLLTPDYLMHMPPVEWLVQSYVAEGAFSVLFGRWGSGKSFLALDWACCVATGREWLGRPVKQGPVLYLAPEGAGGGWGKRLNAWTTIYGPIDGDVLRFIRVPVNLYRREEHALLDELHRQGTFGGHDPVLIVIDTQARAMVGGEEDSAKDMGLFVAACDHLRQATGCHVLDLHHTPKAAGDARGSGALHGAADAMYYIEKSGRFVTLNSPSKTKDEDERGTPAVALALVPVPGTGSCVLDVADAVPLVPGAIELLKRVASTKIPCGTNLAKWAEEGGMAHTTAYRYQRELLRGPYVAQGAECWELTPLGQRACTTSTTPVP